MDINCYFCIKIKIMNNSNIGKAVYGIIDNGIFGVRIVSGIVTGVSYTENNPIYEISFGKDKWRTSKITYDINKVIEMCNIADLNRVEKSHNLKIKYKSV